MSSLFRLLESRPRLPRASAPFLEATARFQSAFYTYFSRAFVSTGRSRFARLIPEKARQTALPGTHYLHPRGVIKMVLSGRPPYLWDYEP